jgi:hypothetical protein
VTVQWSPSTDDVGVVEYGVYRDNGLMASQAELTATVSNLRCGTSYEIAVDATDAAGNRSEKARIAVSTNTCAAAPSGGPGGTDRPNQDNPNKPDKADHPQPESTQNAVESASADQPASLEPKESPTSPADPSRVDRSTPSRATGPTREVRQVPTPSREKEDRYSRPRVGLQSSAGRRPWPSFLGPHPVIPGVFDVLSLGLTGGGLSQWSSSTFRVFAVDHLLTVRWDGRTLHSRGALKLHMDWSGRNYKLWIRQHRRAFERLPA